MDLYRKIRERELNFAIDTAGIATLRNHPLYNNAATSLRRERSVYFDTTGFRLHKAGFILRVRNADECLTQTSKLFPRRATMLFDRGEWECDVTDEVPDYEAAASTTLAEMLSDMTVRDAIAVRFETLVDQTSWQIDFEGARLALTLDQGELITGSVKVPLCELDLELVTGELSALFGAAAELARTVALRPLSTSKADRGLALVKAVEFRPTKAEPVELERRMGLIDAAQSIITNGIDHLCRNTAVLSQTRDPDALHQAHIATRRLRTAMRMFQSHVNADRESGWNRAAATLRELADILGEARDLDVLMSQFGSDPGIHARLALRRNAAYDRVAAQLHDPAHGRHLIELLAQVQGEPSFTGSLDGTIKTFAQGRLDRLRRRLLKAAHDMSTLSPEKLHRVRVSAKRLRYACEFFRSLSGGKRSQRRYRAMINSLGSLQSALGDLNDRRNATLVLGPEYQMSAMKAAKLFMASRNALAELHRVKRFWR
jgi:triphosphatase